MAKAPAKPDTEGSAPPKKKGKLLLILIIVIVLLLVAAGGVFLLLLKKNKSPEETSQDAATPPPVAVASTIDLTKPPTFVPLDPFTVNLRRDEGDHYLQVVMVLHVSDAKMAESLRAFMPAIRHRINLLLSSKLPSELDDTEGREQLAIEVGTQVNEALGFPALTTRNGQPVSNGPVQSVLFNSFIIQ